MPPALLTLLIELCRNKKAHLSVISVLIIISVWSMGKLWATISCQPAIIAQHETRLTTLEFDKASQSEQLRAINHSLNRIETSVGETRRDVSDLKTTLIRGK